VQAAPTPPDAPAQPKYPRTATDQARGGDPGTTAAPYPDDAVVLKIARSLLGLDGGGAFAPLPRPLPGVPGVA